MSTFINGEDPDEMQHSSVSTLLVKVEKEYNIFFNILPDTPRYEQCIKVKCNFIVSNH